MQSLGQMMASFEGTMVKQAILITMIRVVLTLVIGYVGLRLIMRFSNKALKRYATTTEHIRKMILHIIYYTVVLLILISILHELNFQITALLGAAGILTAAVGFASQTSISNIVSGLFLLSEGFYKVGDDIEVVGTPGIVDSIDLLSIKLRKENGTYVRIPHTTLITHNVINNSYFPERRFDFKILVSYKENPQKVMAILVSVIQKNQFARKDKPPYLECKEFSETTLSILVGVWTDQKNWVKLKDSIMPEVQEQFAKEQVLLPIPMYISFEKPETF